MVGQDRKERKRKGKKNGELQEMKMKNVYTLNKYVLVLPMYIYRMIQASLLYDLTMRRPYCIVASSHFIIPYGGAYMVGQLVVLDLPAVFRSHRLS